MAQNLITVRQQLKNLLASVQLREEILRKRNVCSSSDDSKELGSTETCEFIVGEDDSSRTRETDIESMEIATVYNDFKSLLNDKLREESSDQTASPLSHENAVPKRPFLRKGEGIARFRMKPRQPKRKAKICRNSEDNGRRFSVSEDVQTKFIRDEVRSAPLIAFEQLEQKLDDSSFCSTSSMVVRLMEDSIKSTPIKSINVVEPLQALNLRESDSSYSDRGTLDVIDEEINAEDDAEESLKALLQTRSLELEAEVDLFKTESSLLSRLRANYEREYNQFCRERIELLEKIRAEHLSGANALKEEKEKLRCEKRAFDKYVKEKRNRTAKEENEEIRLLKEEINVMKEEMNRKEKRWTAAQAKNRTEVKLLKDQNAVLQEEVNDLKRIKKKVMFAPALKKSKSFSSVNDASKVVEKGATLLRSRQLDSVLDLPSISDSGVFFETFHSSNESCNNIPSNMTNFPEKNDSSDKIFASESSLGDPSEFTDSDGNRVKEYADGRKEIWYANGSVKKISSDAKTTKTIFYNGDVEERNVDENVVKYYHAASGTWHSEFNDGLEIKEFADGQVERYYANGSVEIVSPDGTIFVVNSCGQKKWKLTDGSVVTIDEEKREKRIVFPNGQIEVHVPEFKRREYPDGTIKTIYSNSSMQETRYPNGRIRLKTHDGTLISDTETWRKEPWKEQGSNRSRYVSS